MSDVEKQIEQWRTGLAGSETFGTADIRELESHLREEIDHLKSLKLSDEEAFLVARHRLGDTARLEQEFAKINPQGWLVSRLCWITAGMLLWVVAGGVGGTVSVALLWLGCLHILGTVGLTIVRIVLPLTTVAAVVAAGLWWYLRYTRTRLRTGHGPSRARMVAVALGCLLIVQVLFGLNIGQRVCMVRSTDMAWYARVVQAGVYSDLASAVLVPTLLTGLFLVLYLRRRRDIQVQS
jgi:hypothetical protein